MSNKKLIAVIADDFTGAAEIGGVGLKYGLRVVIETAANGAEDADLLVIAADTRNLSAAVAASEVETITRQLLKHKPGFIFKKLDSVLRGNIAEEIIAQLKASGKKQALLIAGNPSFGRVIENGVYRINGVPLAQTSFAKDPDFPVRSSNVNDIVSSDLVDTFSLSVEAELPGQGIILGDVKHQLDMENWVQKVQDDTNTLLAGGAGFFDTLINKRFDILKPDCEACFTLGKKTLFVFGSKFPKDPVIPLGLDKDEIVKINMPDEIYQNPLFDPDFLINWAKNVVQQLEKGKKVIVTSEQDFSAEKNISERIRSNMGELVRLIMERTSLNDLLIEGGATTSAILKALKLRKLYPNKLLYPGIIQMKTNEFPDMTITTKPGSYLWPDDVELKKDIDIKIENV